jgi:lipid A 4'-phosphatase
VVTSGLRMAFGGHFFTDVAAAGLVSFFVIWLVHAWIYRWPSTRLTDEEIEGALGRWGSPGYRLWQRWRGRPAG